MMPWDHAAGRIRNRMLVPALILLLVGLLGTGMHGTSGDARASSITPEAALVRIVTASRLQASWFAPSFLAHVTVDQVQQAVAAVKATLGPYQSIKAEPDGSLLLTFERGTDRAQIALDNQGRVIGLFYQTPQLAHGSLTSALQDLRALPGRVSVFVAANGASKASINPDQLLAVGSSFKLAVLAALQREIAAGKLSWSGVVTLQESDKSLPSGILQTWPAGTPLTVATLAALMISQSDNTAADTLIHLVGRDAIDALIPTLDRPILTTREAFVLKDPAHADLRVTYLEGNQQKRLAVLAEADRLALPPTSLFAGGPVATDVEWFFSTRQLCGLMQQVHTLPLMGINPGVANPADWAAVAYKGGSEPGVLNLTTMVTTKAGQSYCVSATWNNAQNLDESRFELMYSAVLSALR